MAKAPTEPPSTAAEQALISMVNDMLRETGGTFAGDSALRVVGSRLEAMPEPTLLRLSVQLAYAPWDLAASLAVNRPGVFQRWLGLVHRDRTDLGYFETICDRAATTAWGDTVPGVAIRQGIAEYLAGASGPD